MKDVGHAGACQMVASRTGRLAGRSLSMQGPRTGRWGRRWAYSPEAYEGPEAIPDLAAAVAGGCWTAPRANPPGSHRRHRSRCPGWARARSGKPASEVRLALRQYLGRCATVCSTYLDQVLALSLGDEGLQFGGGEGVDQARL